ncbi:MAG: efflux RND transporter periplasmic adaptor subunit, partial [Dongiaceae bacterium]
MRPRSLLLIGAVLALLGGVIAWSHYRNADPVSAEAAMQPAAKAQDAGQNSAGGGKPAVAVKVAEVTQASMPIRRRTIGWAEPIATVAVKSRVDSQIVEQFAKDGQFVRQGDVLFRLDDLGIKALIERNRANMAREAALLARARADLERIRNLVAKKTASQQQLDLAMADAKSAEASVASNAADVKIESIILSYATIEAPISGRLGAVQVTPGNLVQANSTTALVTITQMSPIRVAFTLADRDLDALRAALNQETPAVVRVFAKGEAKARATGYLNFIDSSVDTGSGTITAKAEFANEDLSLWPGQYFDVEIELGTQPAASAIPTVALQVGQDGLFVFVVTPENKAEMRKVTVAGSNGDMSAVS